MEGLEAKGGMHLPGVPSNFRPSDAEGGLLAHCFVHRFGERYGSGWPGVCSWCTEFRSEGGRG